jgi:paraquat-inducible protein B
MMSDGSNNSDDNAEMNGASEAPRAVVLERARLSIVWLIPLVAAIVGIYLAYWAWLETGPTITITFESAEGLEAGKTKLKYKKVEIGLVESVELSDDLSQVEVTASMAAGTAQHLTENTRFWVVRAQVSAGQITGLDTVLSGVYIAVDPSSEGQRARRFVGLEKPPVVTSDKPGTLFNLQAQELGSVSVGSPVYFRWLPVGQVAAIELDEAGEHVSVQVFVEAPHDRRVRSTTRFWNASGFDVTVGGDGLKIDSPSLISMLAGGIGFETPATTAEALDVPEGMIFELYPSKQATRQPRYLQKSRFILYFTGSVSGLTTGSTVEYLGIKIGEVLSVDLRFDPDTNDMSIPIVIEIEPERFGLEGEMPENGEFTRLHDMVDKGFRARISTGNFLTGEKSIKFDYQDDFEPGEIRFGEKYPVLPTVAAGLDAIAGNVISIVEKVDHIPIESIGRNLDEVLGGLAGTLDEVRKLAGTANEDLIPRLSASLEKLEGTLGSAESLIAPESAMAQDLQRLMADLSEAARSIRILAERLEEHPEELLRGKSE